MIILRLEEIGRTVLAIQPNRKSIAVFALWATQSEIYRQPKRPDEQSHIIQRPSALGNRIRLVAHGPAMVYLNVLFSCIYMSRGRVTEHPGSEQAARIASMCLLHALSDMDPASVIISQIRQQYLAVIPPTANFKDLSCYHTLNAIHALLISRRDRQAFSWADYKPCAQEHVSLTAALAQVAYARGPPVRKVPRWILRFVIRSLSQDPPPPTSVILDCLSIVAIDLNWDVSSTEITTPDERYAQHLIDVDPPDSEPVYDWGRFRVS